MSDGWPARPLGDLIELHDHKRVPLSAAERSKRQGPYPYYGAQGIIDYIDEYRFDGRFILVPEDGANLTTRNLPIAYFAAGQFWVNNHAHVLRGKDGVALDEFIVAALNNANISGYVTGAAQPKLSQANLKRIELRVPPLPTQHKIAAILSAYDDLTENNLRRIRILEEMAQLLYREWFVHYRFPGHEDVAMVDSELGEVPEGWEVCAFDEAVEVNPKETVRPEDDTPYLPMASLSTSSMIVGPFEDAKSRSGSVFRLEDTLFPRINPSLQNGKTGYVHQLPSSSPIGAGSTEFVVLRSRNLTPRMVYLISQEPQFREAAERTMVGASGRQRIRMEIFGQVQVAVPPKPILDTFDGLVGPMFKLVGALAARNQVLRQTRDLLLPRLISGDLDVSDLDVEVAPA